MAKIKRIDNATIQIRTKHTGATHPRLAKHTKAGKPSGDPQGSVSESNFRNQYNQDEGFKESTRKQEDHQDDIDTERERQDKIDKEKNQLERKENRYSPAYTAYLRDNKLKDSPQNQATYTKKTGKKP